MVLNESDMAVLHHVPCYTAAIMSHPLSPVGNKSCYLCIWRKLRSQPLTLSSLLHRLVSAASVRSGAKMTFYDDIYPFYPLQRTSFIFSGRLLTIILVFLVLAVSLLLILPGIRGKSVSASDKPLLTAVLSQNLRIPCNFNSASFPSCQRLFWMFRIVISLFIGVVIVGEFCIYCHCC